MRRIVVKAVALALLTSLVSVQPALAYIDPSTGGILFQALATALALFSGAALIFSRQIRMAFARAMRLLRGLFNRDTEPAEEIQTRDQRAEVQDRR